MASSIISDEDGLQIYLFLQSEHKEVKMESGYWAPCYVLEVMGHTFVEDEV
jgi:hypothetical protein